MRDTIKAKVGYRVVSCHSKIVPSEHFKVLYDGDTPIFKADAVYTTVEHEQELKNNEAYHICEIFTTAKGNKYLYTRDEEVDEDYLVKVNG